MFNIHWIVNNVIIRNLLLEVGHKYAMYILKQIIMLVQANPKTQPGGVQGALDSSSYQADGTPLLVKKLPMTSAKKLIKRNIIIL